MRGSFCDTSKSFDLGGSDGYVSGSLAEKGGGRAGPTGLSLGLMEMLSVGQPRPPP